MARRDPRDSSNVVALPGPHNPRDVVRAAVEADGRSLQQIARDARAAGHSLSVDSLSRFLLGRVRTLSPASLDAVSAVLGIPRDQLQPGADDVVGTPLHLPAEAMLLNSRERELVLELVHALVAAHRH